MSSISPEQAAEKPFGTVPALPPIRWTERYFRLLWGVAGISSFLIIWQLGVVSGLLDRLFVSTPIDVLITAVRLLPSRDFDVHLVSTAQCLFLGLFIALLGGIVIGLPLGWFPTLNAMFEPVIAGIYGVPYIAFLPVIIMWTGIGVTSRIIIVVWSAVFPVMINAIQGAREVDDDYLRVGRSFSATNLQMFFTIALPSAIPYILAGLRTSIGRAIVGTVVAEFFMSSRGLGYFINLKANSLEMAPAFVAVVVLALFGIGMVSLVTYLENRFCSW